MSLEFIRKGIRLPWLSERVKKEENQRRKQDRFLYWTMLIIFIFFIFSLIQLNFDYSKLWTGTSDFFFMLGKMFPPNPTDWFYILAAAVESLQIAIVGTVVAIVISFFLAFLGATNLSPNKGILWFVKGFAALMRAIPAMIWALLFIVSVGMGPLAGIMALGIHSLGMLIKVYAESVEEVDDGLIEAMRATGASWLQIVLQGILPMVFTSFLSWSIFRLEIDIRYSTILGMVGAGGIGWELVRAMRMYKLDEAMFITIVIFIMIFLVELAGNQMKKKIIKL